MSKELKRRWVYKELYDYVMKWGYREHLVRNKIMPPNNKPNFPYYLDEYIKHLKRKE